MISHILWRCRTINSVTCVLSLHLLHGAVLCVTLLLTANYPCNAAGVVMHLTIKIYAQPLPSLKDFGAKQERAGKIEFDSNVVKISRRRRTADSKTGATTEEAADMHFVLTVNHEPSLEVGGRARGETGSLPTRREVVCKVVVMATGLSLPNAPTSVDGVEHTLGYESLPPTGESFEGQSVAVLGLGNAVRNRMC